MERGKVDLRTCEKGDILISVHGAVLEYVRPCNEKEYLDHRVKYIEVDGEKPKNSFGTRTHDGFVFKKNRMDSDHDIVEIRKLKAA